MPNPLDFGHLLEGTIEQDPISDRYSIRTVDAQGKPISVDLDELFARFIGQDVRMTLVSLESLAELAKLVEEGGGGGQVLGIPRDQLPPVPFNRKP